MCEVDCIGSTGMASRILEKWVRTYTTAHTLVAFAPVRQLVAADFSPGETDFRIPRRLPYRSVLNETTGGFDFARRRNYRSVLIGVTRANLLSHSVASESRGRR